MNLKMLNAFLGGVMEKENGKEDLGNGDDTVPIANDRMRIERI